MSHDLYVGVCPFADVAQEVCLLCGVHVCVSGGTGWLLKSLVGSRGQGNYRISQELS